MKRCDYLLLGVKLAQNWDKISLERKRWSKFYSLLYYFIAILLAFVFIILNLFLKNSQLNELRVLGCQQNNSLVVLGSYAPFLFTLAARLIKSVDGIYLCEGF